MKHDVIIVLGGGINADGSLPAVVKKRVGKAVELYKKGMAPRLIMSGKWSINSKISYPCTEAEAMEEYAVLCGVERDDILVEKESQDTLGNAYWSKINFLKPAKWQDIVVVTSDFHIKRAKYLFGKVLGPDYRLSFVGVKTNFSEKMQSRAKQDEAEKFAFFKSFFRLGSKFFDFDK